MLRKPVFKDNFSRQIFFRHFRFIMVKDIPLLALNFVVYIVLQLAFPLFSSNNANYNIHYIAFFVLPLAPVLLNFKYVTGVYEADMMLSLPQSKRSLYYTRFLSGLITLVLPAVIVYLIAGPIMGIVLPTTTYTPDVYFSAVLVYFLTMFFFYAFALFLCMHAGRIFYTVIYYVVFSVLPVVFLNGAVNEVTGKLFGFITDVNYFASNGALGYHLPEGLILIDNSWFMLPAVPGYIINHLFLINDYMVQFIIHIVVTLLLTAFFAVTARRMHQKRKGDQTQRIEVFKYFTILLSILISLSIGYFAALNTKSFLPTLSVLPLHLRFILFSIIFYYISASIFKGTSRPGFKAFLGYIPVLAAYGLIAVIISTQCFGRVFYVPAASDIKSVEYYFPINKSGSFDVSTSSMNFNVIGTVGSGFPINLNDNDDKAKAISLHSAIVNELKHNKKSLIDSTTGTNTDNLKVYIKYTLKSGMSMYRYYDISVQKISAKATEVLNSAGFRKDCGEKEWKYPYLALERVPNAISFYDNNGANEYAISNFTDSDMFEMMHTFYEDDIKLKSNYNKDKIVYMRVSADTLQKYQAYPFVNAFADAYQSDYGLSYEPKMLCISKDDTKLWNLIRKRGVFSKIGVDPE